jgi:hypothetical protein
MLNFNPTAWLKGHIPNRLNPPGEKSYLTNLLNESEKCYSVADYLLNKGIQSVAGAQYYLGREKDTDPYHEQVKFYSSQQVEDCSAATQQFFSGHPEWNGPTWANCKIPDMVGLNVVHGNGAGGTSYTGPTYEGRLTDNYCVNDTGGDTDDYWPLCNNTRLKPFKEHTIVDDGSEGSFSALFK